MADKTPHGPLELGADMDYQEHEKTYSMFLGLAKYVLVAMAFGFFTSAGFFSATILFILLCGLGVFLLR